MRSKNMLYIQKLKVIWASICLIMIAESLAAQQYELESAPFNSIEADFSAAFGPNQIVFCSSRSRKNAFYELDTTNVYSTDLYECQLKADGTYASPSAIHGKVNSIYNEGQATINSTGTVMYFTSNLKKADNNVLDKVQEYKLGIFKAVKEDKEWVLAEAFPFNSQNGKYNVAHPYLACGDSILYFSSNMPGGMGKSDIYKCYFRNGQWSQPENLGKIINTRGNEFFPFVNEFGTFFFSTDGREDSEGVDIYSSLKSDMGYTEPVRLNSPINSEFDDFAYYENIGKQVGCISTNRDEEQDDIYLFKKYNESFNECGESENSYFCYHFEEPKIPELKNSPFKFQWNFGDGNAQFGKTANHCYEKFGAYNAALNIIDTTTNKVFARLGEINILIHPQIKPTILCSDTVYKGNAFECKIDLSAFQDFEISEVIWQIPDHDNVMGESTSFILKNSGSVQIRCELVGKSKSNGIKPKVCVYKEVMAIDVPANMDPKLASLGCCDKIGYRKLNLVPSSLKKDENGERISPFYKLAFLNSKKQLEFTDVIFKDVPTEITEIKTEAGYEYSIGKETEWTDLTDEYLALRSKGFEDLHLEEFNLNTIKPSITKQGFYTNPSDVTINNNGKDKDNSPKQEQPKIYKVVVSNSTCTKIEEDSLLYAMNPEKCTFKSIDNSDYSEVFIQQKSTLDSLLNILNGNYLKFAVDSSYIGTNWNTKKYNFDDPILPLTAKDLPDINQPRLVNDSSLYVLIIATSKEKLGFNNPILCKVDTDITELKTDSGYAYSVICVDNFDELQPYISEYKQKGYTVQIDSISKSEYAGNTLERGKYIAPKPAVVLDIDNSIKDIQLAPFFHVVILDSKIRIPFNDSTFKKVTDDISELKVNNGYEYSVGLVNKEDELQSKLTEMKKLGFDGARIDSLSLTTYNTELSKKGKFIQPGDASALNVEFSKLKDIKFEYNSAEIKPESYPILDYIVAMLKVEDEFTLKISAHTCDMGGQIYNLDLSDRRAQSVVNYFVQKGIDSNRLTSKGYGQSRPVANNKTEPGRAQNRRVEFVIVFTTKKTNP
jgi:outer membrane protein OmpA-like peptidoglycan-associated protein